MFLKILCIKCNNKKDFYYLNTGNLINLTNQYIDCVNNYSKPSNSYFDKEAKEYRLCYETCLTC